MAFPKRRVCRQRHPRTFLGSNTIWKHGDTEFNNIKEACSSPYFQLAGVLIMASRVTFLLFKFTASPIRSLFLLRIYDAPYIRQQRYKIRVILRNIHSFSFGLCTLHHCELGQCFSAVSHVLDGFFVQLLEMLTKSLVTSFFSYGKDPWLQFLPV